MIKVISGIGLFLLVLATGGYFAFRPAETRKQDRQRFLDKAKNAWGACSDYAGKLFQGEAKDTATAQVSEMHRPSQARDEALAS
jgi:hypothetical protein